jgi:uroporphyrinogen decarboxylase
MIESSFLDACQQKPTDHTPVWYMRQAGRCFPEYRKLKETYDILTLCKTPELAAQVTMMPVNTFKVDAAILFADIMLPLMGMGVDLAIVEHVGPVIANPIANLADVQALTALEPDRDLDYLKQTIAILLKELDGKTPLIGFSGSPFTLASYLIEGKPSKDFLKTKHLMYTQPETWSALMQLLTDAVISYLQMQVRAGVQAIQLFDSWVGCLSRDDFRTYVLPYSRQIFAGLNSCDIPRIHFATNTAAFLEDFASVDCEVVGIDWRLPLDVGWQRIGSHKAIQGNLEPALLLADFDLVKKRVDTIFDSLPTRDGFIFNLGHGVLPDTTVESLIKLTDYVHSK